MPSVLDIEFEVRADHNPVPYKRTTQRQKHTDMEYRRYQQYKSLIIATFAKVTGKLPHQVLQKKTKYRVEIIAFYKDKTHGDTDNVAKGVNDAIFASPLSDKYVCGSYDFCYDRGDPRVYVRITQEDPTEVQPPVFREGEKG